MDHKMSFIPLIEKVLKYIKISPVHVKELAIEEQNIRRHFIGIMFRLSVTQI
jgi:hypothetical protein